MSFEKHKTSKQPRHAEDGEPCRILCRHLTAGAATWAGVMMLATAPATAQAHRYNIASQGLVEALLEFGFTAHVRVVFDTRHLSDAMAPALSGLYDDQVGLERLLRSSGFVADWADEGRVVIRPADGLRPAS